MRFYQHFHVSRGESMGLSKRHIFRMSLAFVFGVVASGCGDKKSTRPGATRAALDAKSDHQQDWEDATLVFTLPPDQDPADSFPRAVKRLNQVLGGAPAPVDWKPDPMLDSLPRDLVTNPRFSDFGAAKFGDPDVAALREVALMRAISATVAGQDTTDRVGLAQRLFDWTTRNIQLAPGAAEESRRPYLPWHTLLLGKGTALERSWVFTLLARQRNLEVVLLSIAGRGKSKSRLLPALFWDQELYLFDSELGLPLPDATGKGVLTLSAAAGDDSLLRRLDLDDEHPYPLQSADLESVVAYLETQPLSVSWRGEWLGSKLAGDRSMVVSIKPSDLADRLKNAKHVESVELWTLPYERTRNDRELSDRGLTKNMEELRPFEIMVLWEEKKGSRQADQNADPTFLRFDPRQNEGVHRSIDPALWLGRVLHLSGHLTGESSASYYYGMARLASSRRDRAISQVYSLLSTLDDQGNSELMAFLKGLLPGLSDKDKQRMAKDPTFDGIMRNLPPSSARKFFERFENVVAKSQSLGPADRKPLRQFLEMVTEILGSGYLEMAQAASWNAAYWQGLIAYERGEYSLAADHFENRVLGTKPDSPWAEGARYNWARSLEAEGKFEQAASLLQGDPMESKADKSPQRHGNLLRARWLATRATEHGQSESAKPPASSEIADPASEGARQEPTTPSTK